MASKSAPLSTSTEIDQQGMVPVGEFALADDDDVQQERYCLDLFHRALARKDQQAQFQLHFGETVRGWIRHHFKRELASHFKQEEYYVAQTFACFWQITSRYQESEFSTFAAILQHLHASLNSIIIAARRASLSTTVAMATMPNDGAEVWKRVQSLLTDSRQQRIAYLLFHCGLKPREIVQSFPEEFSDVSEISHIRYKIMAGILGSNS
jgi:hypothetical protein